MTGLVMGLLKKLGVVPEFSNDEVLDASTEDNFYDHRKVVEQLQAEVEGRKEANSRLRTALQVAKAQSTSPFADFEHAIRGETKHGNGN